jgi:hypothetical protein
VLTVARCVQQGLVGDGLYQQHIRMAGWRRWLIAGILRCTIFATICSNLVLPVLAADNATGSDLSLLSVLFAVFVVLTQSI